MNRRIVIKIGSSSLNHPTGGLDDRSIEKIVKVISEISAQGVECILVSSGAVAAGVGKLGLATKPKDVAGRQAVASIGQGVLIEKYAQYLDDHNLVGAQILLSRIDLADPSRYKNAQNTLEQLLKFKAIPIINENDTVAVEELCFGDNDRLSALVAGIIHADLLVIFTDVDGLYTANPKTYPEAELIEKVEDIAQVKGLAGGAGTQLGTGGMITKLKAAEIATRFGIGTYLVNSNRMKDLPAYFQGEKLTGTYFIPAKHHLVGKKRWIAYGGLSEGSIIIDDGAVKALAKEGKSLLATGIIGAEGEWERKELVRIVNVKGTEIARGLVELSSEEVILTQGKHSDEVLKLIPDLEGNEIVHRDNMTLMI